ncbi:MAG: nuclear transport factor 2 family protein, partial [Bacteroidales bacterium]
DEDQKELIKNVIQSAYVDGLCNNADADAVSKGFHPGFTLLGVGSGNIMWTYPIYSWMESAKSGKMKGLKYSFQNELTTIKFLFIDVSGNAAVAKIEFYEGNVMKFIDYLSLLKFEDGWKIVSKTFYSIPQEKK